MYHDPDMELEDVLRAGDRNAKEIHLMRLGGPRAFRKEVISILNNETTGEDEIIRLLLSERIPRLTILLPSPENEPFLARMDAEEAISWKIWRVRTQIYQFAQALDKISSMRKLPQSLMVGFHCEDLIWNISVAGNHHAVVRPYSHRTGHDPKGVTIHLENDTSKTLVQSFLNYFNSVSRKPSTRWLLPSTEEIIEPRWPSLYKANAVKLGSQCDPSFDDPIINENEFCKICANRESQVSEEKWFGMRVGLREHLRYFRPAQLCGPFSDLRGEGLRIKKVEGPSVFALLGKLNNLNQEGNYGLNPQEVGARLLQHS